jgi:hypothetical protein
MKKEKLLFVLISFFLLSSCLKKKLDLDLLEPQCKNFKIKGIRYEFVADPTCDSTQTTGILKVKGEIDGSPQCVAYMIVDASFYDKNGSKIQPLTGSSQKVNIAAIVIENGTFAFNYNYTFSQSDYSKINFMHLNYYVENELEFSSNQLSLRANPACAKINPPTTFDRVITIGDTVQFIQVNFADHAAQDGDLISLNVNGVWVLENILLTKAGENYSVPVKKGENWFYLYALNQGSSGPNTVTITVKTNLSEQKFEFNLKTAESRTFKIIVI